MSKSSDENAYFHVLPHPAPKIDPLKQPIVGNLTVDDNILEWVQIAVWKAIGEAKNNLQITVKRGVVTLSGRLAGQADRDAAVTAARQAKGVRRVVDKTVVEGGTADLPAPPEYRAPKGVSMACARRYCGTDDASITAAIRDGLRVLNEFAMAHRLKPAKEFSVLYTMPIPGAVTVDVCQPLPVAHASQVSDGIGFRHVPPVTKRKLAPKLTFQAVLRAARELSGADERVPGVFWQRFTGERARSWSNAEQALEVFWSDDEIQP